MKLYYIAPDQVIVDGVHRHVEITPPENVRVAMLDGDQHFYELITPNKEGQYRFDVKEEWFKPFKEVWDAAAPKPPAPPPPPPKIAPLPKKRSI